MQTYTALNLHEDKNISFAISCVLKGLKEYGEQLSTVESICAVHNITKKQAKEVLKLANEFSTKLTLIKN